MILKIRQSRTFKGACVFMAFNILAQIVSPLQALALSGGPAQPEFSSFTPIGTSDMVDLSSGDMSYNIPLMDVGGYPLNIAYSSGVGMDDESSWVGLGWNLSVGQINHNVRGMADDFDGSEGDEMVYENNLKPNINVGGSFKVTPNFFGLGADGNELPASSTGNQQNDNNANNDAAGPVSFGLSASYSNYNGFELKQSIGIQKTLSENVSIGFSVENGSDGLSISPQVSFSFILKGKNDKEHDMKSSIGLPFNSRQGISELSLNMNKKTSVMNAKNNERTTISEQSIGSSIGFTDNIYTPFIRNEMITSSFAVNVALGSEFFGGEMQGEIRAFGTIQALKEKNKSVKAYGYNNTQKAGQDAVLDFNREKDGALSKNTTNLALTNYTYDIHSVQGQGVGGMYRPYRSQVGYVYDPLARDVSVSANLGLEFGVGNAAHNGWDLGVTLVNSHSGLWNAGVVKKFNNASDVVPDYEEIYYKNVGDISVDRDFTANENSNLNYQLFNKVGEYEAVRIPFVGIKFFRMLTKKYIFKNGNELPINSKIHRSKRQLRNQSITHITNSELANGVGYGVYVNQPVTETRKGHHVGEIQILRNDGARYIYGLPLYNKEKKEVTFAIKANSNNVDCAKGLIDYSGTIREAIDSKSFKDLPYDKYFNRTTTPAYVHTHLLTSVLSTDYVDLDEPGSPNFGPSDNDLGSYTKFNYSAPEDYNWRVPLEENMASYNEGLKTDPSDDQGNYTYGVKEQRYINSIETKTHIAIFELVNRQDAFGVEGEHGKVSQNSSSKRLKSISLYSKADYYSPNGTINSNATPIKKVHLVYNYDLCKNVLNNLGNVEADLFGGVNNKGKLTLKKIYFTYRNSKMGKYTSYLFDYNETDPNQNPDYNLKGYDTWGNYKPTSSSCSNTSALTAMEFPYTSQDKDVQDVRAAVWSLKKIELPSGGFIEIDYESDDYRSVQNKGSMRMYEVAGVGNSSNGSSSLNNDVSDVLFSVGVLPSHKKYLYVKIPPPPTNTSMTQNVQSFFNGLMENKIIQFRFLMNMTPAGAYATSNAQLNEAKFDFVSGYAELDNNGLTPASIFSVGTQYYLSVPLKLVHKEGGLAQADIANRNPISKATWQFGRTYLNKHVYSSFPNGDPDIDNAEGAIMDILEDLFTPSILTNLFEVFAGANGLLETKGIGRRFIKAKSFIRLAEPSKKKLGGGCRVKTVKMNDVWEKMNTDDQDNVISGYKSMSYGQEYKYTLEDISSTSVDESKISSGVATYEPVGNKENPFVQPVFSTTKHLLAPNDRNFVEKPFGESFFPSPQVTYSRVQVQNLSIDAGANKQIKQLHKSGSVVTEFYTSSDYPTIVDQTEIQAKNDDTGILGSLLKVYSKKAFTASQGYVIHLNDMNGKQKSQRVYAEGQDVAISGVDYIYDAYASSGGSTSPTTPSTNKGKLNNLVTVIYPDGKIRKNTIGVEYDVINDFRENETGSITSGSSMNLGSFFVGIIPGFVPLVIPKFSRSKQTVKCVSTTKVINSFGILKETIAYDAGASVSTRNLAWDAFTGEVLVTETVDEYDEKYYTMNYPAHWVYKGMGAASLNIGFEGEAQAISANSYSLAGQALANDYLVDGDEVLLNTPNHLKAWVIDVQGDSFKIIDKQGNGINLSGVTGFKIIRSGRRNLQSAGVMNVTLMHNPLMHLSNPTSPLTQLDQSFLMATNWDKYRIINAGAVDYSDNWAGSCECSEAISSGITNPYVLNEKGVWRTKSSRTYLTGRNYLGQTTGRREGFFTNFSPFYKISAGGSWYKDLADWTFVSEVSQFSPYGFELENQDALKRFSAAQYGYNNKFPMAVGANTKYAEIGFDGFEDYGFEGCTMNSHFDFKELWSSNVGQKYSHTGRYSIKVPAKSSIKMTKKISCQ
jgi:hypothetical protein